MEVYIILLCVACFGLGLCVRPPADSRDVEKMVRLHLAHQIKQHAQHFGEKGQEWFLLTDILKIVEGKGRA